MIRCSHCSTLNRRGSRYCYRCGQSLSEASEVACPACDRLNPSGSSFCAYCGAGIPQPVVEETEVVPSSAEAVGEGPAGRPMQPDSEGRSPRPLPGWLYAGGESGPDAAAASATAAAQPSAPAEASKYLQDIPDVLPARDAWLAAAQREAKSQPPPAADSARGVPDVKPERRAGCLSLLAIVAVALLVTLTALAA